MSTSGSMSQLTIRLEPGETSVRERTPVASCTTPSGSPRRGDLLCGKLALQFFGFFNLFGRMRNVITKQQLSDWHLVGAEMCIFVVDLPLHNKPPCQVVFISGISYQGQRPIKFTHFKGRHWVIFILCNLTQLQKRLCDNCCCPQDVLADIL